MHVLTMFRIFGVAENTAKVQRGVDRLYGEINIWVDEHVGVIMDQVVNLEGRISLFVLSNHMSIV
jgi:hypothetical protein